MDGFRDWRARLAKAQERQNKTDGGCDAVSKYEKLEKIGQGTFGEVFKAKHRVTKEIVALKKVLMENESEGFPITALREIKILQQLKHVNIVNLIEICCTNDSRPMATFYLVFEFCHHDLAGLLSNGRVQLSLSEIKMVIKQIFNGLFFMHSNKILHRDMKPANILITKSGVLKLADFGLARAFGATKDNKPNRFTSRVVTLWYRPPELLLGERNYTTAIDLWGVGCIMAEMWTRTPIIQGKTEQHQLTLITQLCGSINTETYPGVDKLRLYKEMVLPKNLKRRVTERLQPYVIDPNALDLLDKLLALDPAQRVDSDTALNHDFFWSDPLPSELTKMLSQHTESMFDYLQAKKRNAQNGHGPGPSRAGPVLAANDGQYFDRIF